MNIITVNKQDEFEVKPENTIQRPIVNVDYDALNCMTLYTGETANGELIYITINLAEIDMIRAALANGPLHIAPVSLPSY